MNESAVPLVDVPATTTTVHELPVVRFDGEHQQLSVIFSTRPAAELDDMLEELAELLGFDHPDAIRVHFSGPGASSSAIQATLRFVSRDCDRPIQGVSLSADSREALLREAVGRDVDAAPADNVCFTAPPVRASAALPAPLAVVPVEVEVEVEVELEGDGAAEPSDESPASAEVAGESSPPGVGDAPVAAGPEEREAAGDAEASGDAQVALPFGSDEAEASESPTEHVAMESFLDNEEQPHSRPWGSTEDGDRRVLVLRRSVRSGKSVRFSGDVVLFGDVNAGAQVIADGDIVVLGRLRGLAHAGSRGDSTAVVVGLDMQSGQVRIGDAIAFPEKSEEPMATSRLNNLLRRSSPHPQRFVSPSVARVVDGQIRIEDYHGRLHA
jgi:hypothetical protein